MLLCYIIATNNSKHINLTVKLKGIDSKKSKYYHKFLNMKYIFGKAL